MKTETIKIHIRRTFFLFTFCLFSFTLISGKYEDFAQDEKGRFIVEDDYIRDKVQIPPGKMVVLEKYTVQPGDWLSRIAARHYHDPAIWKEVIMHYNSDIENPDLIYPGDRFMLPMIVEAPPVETAEKEVEDVSEPVKEIDTHPGAVMIANFNSGKMINMKGGEFGAWDKDAMDETQSCEIEFSPETRPGSGGYSLKVIYDVDSPNPAYNGVWMKLNGMDFRERRGLHFWIKGDSLAGFTDIFKVELKNKKGETGSYMVWGVEPRWQKKTVPFSRLRGISDFSQMDELIIVFEDNVASPKSGILYIDDIHIR